MRYVSSVQAPPPGAVTGRYLDNVIDERVSEHPVQSDAVTLHQVLEDKHTVTGYEGLIEGYEGLIEGYEGLIEGYEGLIEG